jgi:hypothetical protein
VLKAEHREKMSEPKPEVVKAERLPNINNDKAINMYEPLKKATND